MFWAPIRLLLDDNTTGLPCLDEIREGFAVAMNQAIEAMWASQPGLRSYDASLVDELHQLMVLTKVDSRSCSISFPSISSNCCP